MRVPARTDAPYCPRCGGTEPFHWPRTDGGICPSEGSNARTDRDKVVPELNVPGAASTARALAAPMNPETTR